MPKHFWFKFEWKAWQDDRALRRCTLETRGFWLECLLLMYELGVVFLEGSHTEIANLIGSDAKTVKRCIADLAEKNAAEIEQNGANVKVLSRRLLKAVNLREYNKLKKREERERQNVKPKSRTFSKNQSLRVLEDSSKEESKDTHINAGEAKIEWTWPMKPLVAAFPEYLPSRVTPAMIGFIEAAVTMKDAEAWQRAIADYRMNFDPSLKRYLPDKTANLLSVFRKHQTELIRNGNHKTTDRNRRHSQPDPQETDAYLASIGANPLV